MGTGQLGQQPGTVAIKYKNKVNNNRTLIKLIKEFIGKQTMLYMPHCTT